MVLSLSHARQRPGGGKGMILSLSHILNSGLMEVKGWFYHYLILDSRLMEVRGWFHHYLTY